MLFCGTITLRSSLAGHGAPVLVFDLHIRRSEHYAGDDRQFYFSLLGDAMKKTFLTAIAIAAVASTAAIAQDYSLNPNFGTYSLNAGFLPDPSEVNIVAGGSINASRLGGSCAGNISNAPDVRLQWSGGRMTIGARSGSDTTLVVNGPDGSWYCNDDANGLDPAMVFNQSGQYDIWVGTYNGGTASAVLYVTEY